MVECLGGESVRLAWLLALYNGFGVGVAACVCGGRCEVAMASGGWLAACAL